MKVRPARAQARPTTALKGKYQTHTFAPPTLGWVANASPTEPPPGGAAVLENFFPTATGAVLRRGLNVHSLLPGPVISFISYISGSTAKLFAATETAIYDVSAATAVDYIVDDLGVVLEDDDVADGSFDDIITNDAAALTAVVSGLTGGYWISTQFSDVDGNVKVIAVNGMDAPRNYDGTTWATTPAITFPVGSPLTSSSLSYVFSFKNRLYFIQKNSTNVWYLPTYAIGGLLAQLPVGASLPLGGTLVFGSTWSTDTGTGGLSEQLVLFSTEGEAVVFQGTDPDATATWSRVGVYRVGKPLGPMAHFRGGGDIAIATDIGLVPLSQALQKDFSVLSANAASARIETEWNKAVRARPARNWNCITWSANQMVVISPPPTADLSLEVYVSNTRTGAWAKFTAWGGSCMKEFQDRLFFGTTDGSVLEANVTGLDINDSYTGVYIPLFSSLGGQGVKTITMSRATLRSATNPAEKLTILRNYNVTLPTAPATTVNADPNAWDVGLWDVMLWGSSLQNNSFQNWRVTPQVGFVVSPALQITSGAVTPLDTEIVQVDVAYTISDVVV